MALPMPPISPTKSIGSAKFLSHGLKLPTSHSWKEPRGNPDAPQWRDCLTPEQKVGVPKLIPPWFRPQNNNKLFQDACDDIGGIFKEVHDTMIDAVQYAHDMWRLQAKFLGLVIMGPTAIGVPGCLMGPALEPTIKQFQGCAGWTNNKAKWRDAIAAGVSECFQKWQDMVTVPGLPWYPAFAAFPGPITPPMANTPSMLVVCPSAMVGQIISPQPMRQAMGRALDKGLKQQDKDKQYDALFDAVASVLAPAFGAWLTFQPIIGVMAMGPVPTFAPPVAPVGPVVAGTDIPRPGHLAV